MHNSKIEYEVRIEGHPLVRIKNGSVKIDGRDFHSDIKSLSSLVDILSGIVNAAQEVAKPRLVSDMTVVRAPRTRKTREMIGSA